MISATSLVGPVMRTLGRDLRAGAIADAERAGLLEGPTTGPVVREDEVAGLPEPARRYLDFMGVVGRRRDRTFVARLQGRFRRGGQAWMPCDAWQVDSVDPIGRIFHMRLDVARVVPMVGRDTYLEGHGRMKGTVLGLLTVADGSGPEFDLGELTTWLNDAVLLAPSMLLDGRVSWSAVDDRSFDLRLTDGSLTVSARVLVDERGAVVDFETDDRYADLPSGLVRARWTTPVDGWTVADGRPLPTRVQAVWHLDDGPLPYVEGRFVPGSVRYGVAAGG